MINITSLEQMKKYFDEESQSYVFVENGELMDVNFEIDIDIMGDGCSCGCDDDDCECGHHHHDDDCECGCHHHDEDDCECGCGCGEDCDCGCKEGKPCTCEDEECSCGCDCDDDDCECGCHSCDCDDEEGTNGIVAANITGLNITCGFIKAKSVEVAESITVEQSIECESISAYEVSSVMLEAKLVEVGVLNSFVTIAKQIYANSVDCIDIICDEISVSENILTCTLFAGKVLYNTFCIAKEKMRIGSAVGQRKNNIITCLDSEIVYESEGFCPYGEYLTKKDEM